jgi:chromosome segregation protein
MFISPQNPVPESHPVDAVFALLSQNPAPRMPAALGTFMEDAPKPSRPPPLDPPDPPPNLDGHPDVRAAYDWLQTERSRLEEYTRIQFEKVQQQHQDLMKLHFEREQESALQVQDINREIQRLATFSESLDERVKKLDEREVELTQLEEKQANLRDDVRALQKSRSAVQQEISAAKETVEELEARAARLKVKEDIARNELRAAEAKLHEAKATWETRETEIAKRECALDQLGQRLNERESAIASEARQVAELHEEVRAFQERRHAIEVEIASREETAAMLQSRLDALAQHEQSSKAELDSLQKRIEESRQAWEQKEAELAELASHLDLRTKGLEEETRALAVQKEEVTKAASEVVGLLQKRKTLEREIQTQITLKDELQSRTSRFRAMEESAKKEFEVWDERLKLARDEWKNKESDLAERYSQLEQRYQNLERSEEAVKRRMTELDETEYRIENEYERQEKQLAMDCREIDRLRAILREHGLDPETNADRGATKRVRREAIRVE